MTTRIKHLYIHVPFCKSICSYCDFCHIVYNEQIVNKWLLKIKNEFKYDEQYETIYIGGGTPSCLNDEQLETLLSYIDPFVSNVKEYTIEINPETINLNKIKIIKNHGINRISIGLQTTNDNLLKLLNRNHTKGDVSMCIELFRDNGLENISVDIMYSLPNQTIDDLKDTLNFVINLNVPHISLYSLTIEENTILAKKGLKPLDEDIEADMYELIEKQLTNNGYIHYEIANYSKDNYQSKHNLGYWNYDDYRGIGAGATGKYNHCRYVYTNNIMEYLKDDYKCEKEILDNKEEAFENIMMSLRTIYGLDLKLFKERYNIDFLNEYKEALFKNNNTLEIKDNHLICNNLEILNTILLDFMD